MMEEQKHTLEIFIAKLGSCNVSFNQDESRFLFNDLNIYFSTEKDYGMMKAPFPEAESKDNYRFYAESLGSKLAKYNIKSVIIKNGELPDRDSPSYLFKGYCKGMSKDLIVLFRKTLKEKLKQLGEQI